MNTLKPRVGRDGQVDEKPSAAVTYARHQPSLDMDVGSVKRDRAAGMTTALQRYRLCLHDVETCANSQAEGEGPSIGDTAHLATRVKTLYDEIRSAWADLRADVDDAGAREMAAAFHDEGQLYSVLYNYLQVVIRTRSTADRRARWKEIAAIVPSCFRGLDNLELIARRQIAVATGDTL